MDEPDYGHLLDSMVVENGSAVPKQKVLQPKVEGEIAFVLKKDLRGPNVTTLDVLQATDYILPAIEIVDSRIQDWKIKLPDTIADNASSAFYVLGGKPTKIEDVDLELIGMVLTKNGEDRQYGGRRSCTRKSCQMCCMACQSIGGFRHSTSSRRSHLIRCTFRRGRSERRRLVHS